MSADTRCNKSGDVVKQAVFSCCCFICKDIVQIIESAVEFAADSV